MADSKNQRENSGSEAEMSREFAARRTVIRGLISSVPVILTVSSGEALANASNLQCIQQPPSLSPEECIDPVDPNSWVWQRYDTFRDEFFPPPIQDPGGGGGNVGPNQVPKQCLLYADEEGEVFLQSGPGLNPFTVSCYASFT